MNWTKLVKICAIGITILEALHSVCESMARSDARKTTNTKTDE